MKVIHSFQNFNHKFSLLLCFKNLKKNSAIFQQSLNAAIRMFRRPVHSTSDVEPSFSYENQSFGTNTSQFSEFPPTQIVIQFSKDIKPITIKWLLQKIRGLRREGGSEFLIRQHPPSKDVEELFLHVAASTVLLLEVAEDLEIRKKDKKGVVRHFTVNDLDDFLIGDISVGDLFTSSEKQSIVRYELENIRALPEELHLPGYPHLRFYEGQSIISALLHWKLIRQVFPLHDEEAVRKLGKNWYLALFGKQPFEDINLYFGESIALYFQFLGFYNAALMVPMVFGLSQIFLAPEILAFFCVFNVLWATGFLELWRRKCAELAFQWGTISMTSLYDEPRPNFQGHMAIDHITGRFQPQYPRWKTNFKMYFVSLPSVVLCMCGAFVVMLISFWCEESVRYSSDIHPLIVYVPSTIYAALVFIMNKYYRDFANYLTEWENHRTQAQFDRHRVTKLVLFEFVNNFVCLFYIAFYIQDMKLLHLQLATMLIIFQVINNLQESVLPLVLRYYKSTYGDLLKSKSKSKKKSENYSHLKYKPLINETSSDDNIDPEYCIQLDIPELHPEDSRIAQTLKESEMDVYEGTYDDYLELFIQFGYVFLFAAVYPAAAFWAVVNNIFEIRSDAFKLCCIYQRPLARKVKDTGAWQRAFELLCVMSVITNCALLYISPTMKRLVPTLSSVEWLFLCVGLEHLLFAVRQIVHLVIPDKPEWVRVALAKFNFQSRQALKNQRMINSHQRLSKKQIHSSLNISH